MFQSNPIPRLQNEVHAFIRAFIVHKLSHGGSEESDFEVIQTRRSVRSFKKNHIPKEVLNRILDPARIAPSGSNRQPWKFIIVKDEALKQKIALACNNQKFIADAPVIVVACGQRLPINRGGYIVEMSMLLDVAIAFTHLILAARAEGLGACWIGVFSND
jgi:nitroreductase